MSFPNIWTLSHFQKILFICSFIVILSCFLLTRHKHLLNYCYMYVCMYVCMFIHSFIHLFHIPLIHVCLCLCAFMCVCVSVCVCVYTHTHTDRHTHTHTPTHIQTILNALFKIKICFSFKMYSSGFNINFCCQLVDIKIYCTFFSTVWQTDILSLWLTDYQPLFLLCETE